MLKSNILSRLSKWPKLQRHQHASNYKRPQLHTNMQTQLEELRSKGDKLEWLKLRQNLLNKYKYINNYNIDAVILSACSDGPQLRLAQDYMMFLRSSGIDPNLATLGKLLRIYNAVYHLKGEDSLSQEQQKDILDIYHGLREKYEILDATSCESLIYGLVATSQWRLGKEVLDMMRITTTPSLSAYTELCVKAFKMGDTALGLELLDGMVRDGKNPKCEVFMEYLKRIGTEHSKTFTKNFESFLEFLQNHEIVISEKVVQCLEELSKRFPENIKILRTTLNRVGKCSGCENFLQIIATSEHEFARLSDSFLNKVLIRQDVFQKSTPDEVQSFKEYVNQTAPYDCVIDGLNVAYSSGNKQHPQVFANLLATVVRHFKVRQKRILVLGRKHMNSWPKDAMNYVRKHAFVFLTNNLSHDDPFLLYATLKSGPATDFFSRDHMKSHAFLLGTDIGRIFQRWQQEHQYSLITQKDNGKIIVKEPIRHLLHAHKVQNTWHLPFQLEYQVNPSNVCELPHRWLCIQILTK